MIPPSAEEQNAILTLISTHRAKFTRMILKKYPKATLEILEDYFQDLFVISCTNYKSFKKSQNKIGWLYKTLKHLVSGHFRDKENNNMLLSEMPPYLFKNFIIKKSTEEDMIFSIITNHLPQEVIIEHVLSQLNEYELILYKLRFKEKLSEKDIALKLKIPYGTARRHLSNLKKKIRKIVDNGVFDTEQKNL